MSCAPRAQILPSLSLWASKGGWVQQSGNTGTWRWWGWSWQAPTIPTIIIRVLLISIMAGTHHIHVRVEADSREVWVDSNPGENQGWLAWHALRHLGGGWDWVWGRRMQKRKMRTRRGVKRRRGWIKMVQEENNIILIRRVRVTLDVRPMDWPICLRKSTHSA